jgi:hypothetical protein
MVLVVILHYAGRFMVQQENKMKLFALALTFSSSLVSATNWQLNSEESSLHFISVKNELIAETHQFTQLTGQWDGHTASIEVPVRSMQTNIPIRNERIWQYVLQAEKFATITVTAPLNSGSINELAMHQSVLLDVPLTLSIAGETASLAAQIRITKLHDSALLATSETPLMLNTNSFKLAAGLAKLQELAGLKHIDPLVPVSFSLRFNQQ